MNIRAALGGILLAALLTAPASAYDVLVVPHDRPKDSDHTISIQNQMRALDGLGIKYDVAHTLNVCNGDTTKASYAESLSVGAWKMATGWKRYKAVIFVGWSQHRANSNGLMLDDFVKFTGYPMAVPALFLPNATDYLSFHQTAYECSTGVLSRGSIGGWLSNTDSTFMAYVPGTPYRWKAKIPMFHLRVTQVHPVRVLVAYTVGRFTERPVADCQDCIVDLGQAADTVGVWAKYFTKSDGTPLYKAKAGGAIYKLQPIIFCQTYYNDEAGFNLWKSAALLDSLSGGAVLANGTTTTQAVGFMNAANITSDGFGVLPGDTAAFYRASLDSVDRLGIPYTLQVGCDSLYARKAWFAGLNNARFTPGGYYPSSQPRSLGNADLTTNPEDPLGRLRTRYHWTSAGDTCTAALLKARLGMVRTAFGSGRTDPVMVYENNFSRTRAGLGGAQADSLLMDLSYAGFTGQCTYWRATPATTIMVLGASGGNMISGTRSVNFVPSAGDAAYRGSVKTIRTLMLGQSNMEYWIRASMGLDPGSWLATVNISGSPVFAQYLPDAGIDVQMLYSNALCRTPGTAAAAGTPYYRSGFYILKWTKMAADAANASRWPTNRKLFEFVSLSQKAAERVNP